MFYLLYIRCIRNYIYPILHTLHPAHANEVEKKNVGAGSGFGAAIAQRFASEGAKVIVADISVEGGQKTAAADPENIVFEQMDVTKAADWKRIVEKAVSLFGKLDVLVNNAGTTYRNKVFHFSSLSFVLMCSVRSEAYAWLISQRWKSPRMNGSECSM